MQLRLVVYSQVSNINAEARVESRGNLELRHRILAATYHNHNHKTYFEQNKAFQRPVPTIWTLQNAGMHIDSTCKHHSIFVLQVKLLTIVNANHQLTLNGFFLLALSIHPLVSWIESTMSPERPFRCTILVDVVLWTELFSTLQALKEFAVVDPRAPPIVDLESRAGKQNTAAVCMFCGDAIL